MKNNILIVAAGFVALVGALAQPVFAQPGLQVGAQAPDFEAATYEGGTLKLSDEYKKGPVVLIFYRGGWCPYCNRHLKAFQEKLSEIEKHGANVVAVSVDKVQKAAESVQSQGLGFEVVSDPSADVLRSYGVVYQVPEPLFKKYKFEYGLDLEAASGETHHMIAVPATYIIDQNGKVVFAYANTDYKVRTSPDEVLAELEKL